MLITKSIYNTLNDTTKRDIKMLTRSITGEQLSVADKTNEVYIAFNNNKLIGFAMLSTYSPENHFGNSGVYLYNFITNIYTNKLQRCGKQLLTFIENDLRSINENNTENKNNNENITENKNITENNIINLDVVNSNIRAFKFFINNGYKVVGKYIKKKFVNKDELITYISLSKTIY